MRRMIILYQQDITKSFFSKKMILVNSPNHSALFAFPQYGLVSLASSLHKHGLDVSIVDPQSESAYEARLLELAGKDRTVGFYTTAYSYAFVKRMSDRVKERHPGVRIVLGGPYATYAGEQLVEDFADIVVLGEGEEVLPLILEGNDLSGIECIIYRDEQGNVIRNPGAGFIEDLDALPLPRWEYFNYRKFRWTHYRKSPLVSIMTSRGCEFKCIYCCQGLISKYRTRVRSPENVVDEIQWDHEKYGVREICVVDDDFTYDPDRVKSICEGIIRRGLNKKVRFQKPNAIRPDRGDREMFQLMKRAGFYFVAIAVENINPDVSRKLRRNIDVDRSAIENTLKSARESGIFINTFFLMGSPYDTLENMQNNIDFACSSPTHAVSFFGMKPYPGSVLHDIIKKRNPENPLSVDYMPSCNEIKALYVANDWEEKDLCRLISKAYRRFYFSPSRMPALLLKLPAIIKNPFSFTSQVFMLIFRGSPAADSADIRNKQVGSLSAANVETGTICTKE